MNMHSYMNWLHISRFHDGALILASSVVDQHINLFAGDTTNQLEHIVIFMELERRGFDPHSQASNWMRRQIEPLVQSPPSEWGEVSHAWASIRIGIFEHLGKDKELQAKYIAAYAAVDEDAPAAGHKIAEYLDKWIPKAWNSDRNRREYDYKRLYQRVLTAAGMQQRNHPLFLRKLDVQRRRESRIPIW